MMRGAMLSTVNQAALLQCVEESDPRPIPWLAAYQSIRAAAEKENAEQNTEAT